MGMTPFEQCSKKLLFSSTMASLGAAPKTITFSNLFKIFLPFVSHLFIPPLCPAIPGQAEGKTEERQDNQAPEETVCNPEAFVEDIRDPVDCCSLGKVLRGLEKSYFSLVFFSHSALYRKQYERRLWAEKLFIKYNSYGRLDQRLDQR